MSDLHNPWRESLENCISGDNYLRASEYRELIEELDDLSRYRNGQHPDQRKATDELERLTRELEEAQKDAERYRWLRDREKTPLRVWRPRNDHGVEGPFALEHLDAAIDAAMSQEKRKDALDRMARDADELGLDF